MPRDRRQFNRFDALLIVELSSRMDDAKYFFGLTKNISFEGFVFESQNYDLKQGDVLEFRLRHPHKDISVSLMGEILWKRETGFECETGVKFVKIDSEARSRIFELVSTDKSLNSSILSGSSVIIPLRESGITEKDEKEDDHDSEDRISGTIEKALSPEADRPSSEETPAEPATSKSMAAAPQGKKKPSADMTAEGQPGPRGRPGRKDVETTPETEINEKPKKGGTALMAASVFIIAAAGVLYGLLTGTLDDLAGYPLSSTVQNIFSSSDSADTATELPSEEKEIVKESGPGLQPETESEMEVRDLAFPSPDEIIKSYEADATDVDPGTQQKPPAEAAGEANAPADKPPVDMKPGTAEKEETPASTVKPATAPATGSARPEKTDTGTETTEKPAVMNIEKIKHPNTRMASLAASPGKKRIESSPVVKKKEKPASSAPASTRPAATASPLKDTEDRARKVLSPQNITVPDKQAVIKKEKLVTAEGKKPPVSMPGSAALKKLFTEYQEEFNDNRNGWDIFSVGAASADIRGGEYKISNKRKEGTLVVLHYADFPHDRAFIIEAYIRPERLSSHSSFGIILGAKDALNNLSFQVRRNGDFIIKQYDDGIDKTMMSGSTGRDISPGGLIYLLRVMNMGGKLIFYLEDSYLGALDSPEFAGNKIGFILEGSSDIAVEKTRSFARAVRPGGVRP
jgi:hypothetical protein